jgi:hypothetical protein
MNIRQVVSKRDWKAFHEVADYIYRQDPHWVSPLHADIEKIFDPGHNKNFTQGGEACLWVLYSPSGTPIGRIAAFIDAQRNSTKEYPVGSIGFFECIRDDEAADVLFDTAEQYLRDRGMQAIDGPVNFGERDRFWGLLTKGWYQPVYQENYNPPYYQVFFEGHGYEPHEQIFTYHGKTQGIDPTRLLALAQKVRARYGITTRYIDPHNLDTFAGHFVTVYNDAFRDFPYFKPLQPAQVAQVFRQMKPIMDPRLVCFAFEGEKPVGFCALIPEINDFLRPAQGRLNLRTLPGFLWRKHFMRPQKAKGIAFGIANDWQRRGLFACIVQHMYESDNKANPKKYSDILLATIRGHNMAMNNVVQTLNVKIQRVHIAYRKMLSSSHTPQPFPFIDTTEVSLGNPPDAGIYPRQ